MTRREFVGTAVLAAVPSTAPATLVLPVHRVIDSRSKCPPEQLHRFWWKIWPEAVRDFQRCGIQLQTTDATGEIRNSPGDLPLFVGLEHGVLNLVLTDRVPFEWDNARALSGVTALYHGYHLCIVALTRAHGHQVPFVSLNTVTHEFLHALLQDIFVSRPKGFQAATREARIDWYATLLWLFHDGAAVRKSAQTYLVRLRSTNGSAISH